MARILSSYPMFSDTMKWLVFSRNPEKNRYAPTSSIRLARFSHRVARRSA